MKKTYKIKFRYTPPIGGVEKVFLSGSFNNWSLDALEMQPQAGIFQLEIELPPGKYSYKFIVDNRWLADETADHFEDDGEGGRNSVIFVGNGTESLFIIPIKFKSKKKIDHLNIAGTFNQWNPYRDELCQIDDETFLIHLLLPAGIYEYKLVVDEKIWITDPANPQKKVDDRGGKNSILEVDERFELFSGNEAELFHFGLVDEHLPSGEEIGRDLIRFSCRTYRQNIEKVLLNSEGRDWEMQKYYSDINFDFYSLMIPKNETADQFQIKLIKNNKEYILKKKDSFEDHFEVKKMASELSWIKQSIIYQIFCDRFYNGDPSLNPDFSEWYYDPAGNPLSPAVRQASYHLEQNWQNWQVLQDHPQKHHTFFGGDLPGVRQKIPYLKELGINCLYFNPLVQSASNHKYDTFEYFQIDPHFGGNAEFEKLVDECHQNGIRIILDFAFNHVGLGFFAFQDCLKNGKKSEYFNWFDWYKWPLPKKITAKFRAADYYQCWWGHAELPDLNFDLSRFHPDENYLHDEKDAKVNEPLVKHLLQAVEFWLKEMDIDGFRLDVPNEVPFWFWKRFRAKVKELKPDAYLVGEIWHNAEEWIEEYFDAVMNYTYFREPVLQYFALQNRTKDTFLHEILQGLHNYGFANLSLMMNLLDSHDTHRFLEAVNGDIRKLKLAVLFQMSWIGVPHIFYGDEVGLQGGSDPDNRRPMNWEFEAEKTLKDLHVFYAELINIRNKNNCLIYGDLKIISDNHLIALERFLNDENILILINNSEQTQDYEIEAEYEDLIDQSKVSGKVELSAFAGKILKRI